MFNEIEIWEPIDIDKVKREFKKEKPEVPCNIWGYIRDLKLKIEELENRIIELESKKEVVESG